MTEELRLFSRVQRKLVVPFFWELGSLVSLETCVIKKVFLMFG